MRQFVHPGASGSAGSVARRRDRPDGSDLSHELVRAGMAWWYQEYAPGDRTLESLEGEARQARRGLWADEAPVRPGEYRGDHSRGDRRQETEGG